MKRITGCAVLGLCVWPLLVACGSDSPPSGSSGTGTAGASAGSPAAGASGATVAGGGGQAASAGAGAAVAGASGSPGASGAGASRGGSSAGSNSAGATDQAGAGGSSDNGGAAGDPGRPIGVVKNCFGDGCPLGECSSISAKQCGDVYPGPLTASSTLCAAAGSAAQYCVTVAKTLGRALRRRDADARRVSKWL